MDDEQMIVSLVMTFITGILGAFFIWIFSVITLIAGGYTM